MESTMRPGGLTTLSVLNFLFSAWKLLEGLSNLLWLGICVALGSGEDSDSSGERLQMFQDVLDTIEESGITREVFMTQLALSLGINILIVPLLICSGIGYLKQKRVLGRWMGTLYGLIASTGGLILIGFLYRQSSHLVQIGHLMSLVYPLLTLYVLNVSFRKDLVQ